VLPRALAPLALAALLAAPLLASAQVPGACTLATDAPTRSQPHVPGQALPYVVNLTAGSVGGDVALRIAETTAGWLATVDPEAMTLAAGATGQATVTITAPPDATAGGSVRLEATLTCNVQGVPAPTAPATVTETFSPGLATVVGPPAGGAGPGDLALLAIAGIVVLAGGTAAALALRRPGLVLEAPDPRRDVAPGGGASFPIVVTNKARDAALVAIEVGELPEGWRVVAPPRELRLDAGASGTVQVLLRSPSSAKPGDAAIVEVRALGARGKPATATIRAFVVGGGDAPTAEATPPARAPGGRRPSVIVRDEGVTTRRR
jgi:hypothetical protein